MVIDENFTIPSTSETNGIEKMESDTSGPLSPDKVDPGFIGSLLRNGEPSSEQSNSGTSSITTSPPACRAKRLSKKNRKQRPRVSIIPSYFRPEVFPIFLESDSKINFHILTRNDYNQKFQYKLSLKL